MKNVWSYPWLFLGTFLFGLGLATPALGQLSLEAFAPAHGATEVGLEVNLTLTFNEAIDTASSFEVSDGFFLGVEIAPDPGFDAAAATVSNDGRTITAVLTLQADTQYWVLLSGATSASGAVLDRPYAFTFTTGSRLPTATVSGTIRNDGVDPTLAFVGLFPETFFENLVNDDDETAEGIGDNETRANDDFVSLAIVTESTGAFTMEFVPPGRYVMLALKDSDQDASPTPGTGDEGFGGYDPDGNRFLDVIEVQEAALDGFMVDLRPLTLSTARGGFDEVQSFAEGGSLTATFAAELTPGGESGSWAYFFYNDATQDTLGIVTFFHLLGTTSPPAGSDSTEADPFPFDLLMPLPEGWLDSDAAVAIMEENGGTDYRARYDDAVINAVLSTTELPFIGALQARADRSHTLPLIDQLAAKTAEFEPQPAWLISYTSEENFEVLIGLLEAETGEIVQLIGRPSSAEAFEADAQRAALDWESDAHLVTILSLESLDTEGKTPFWGYFYYSPSSATGRAIFLSSSTILDEVDVSPILYPSLDPLPENWIDSSVAAAQAETQSNDFRTQHPDAEVTAQLSRGFRSSAPDRAVWRFTYASELDFAFLEIDVDATTGAVITSTDSDADVPDAIALYQNYPNPFNPETTITYAVTQTGPVTLHIYDLLGRHIRTLVNEQQQTAGTYTISWDSKTQAGHPVPSGLYLYELHLATTTHSKMMTVLR